MNVYDTTAVLRYFTERLNLDSDVISVPLVEGTVLPTTLSEVITRLLEAGFERKIIADIALDAIGFFEVEDATMYLTACMIFGSSDFTFSESVELAFCHLDHLNPLFDSPELLDSFLQHRYFSK